MSDLNHVVLSGRLAMDARYTEENSVKTELILVNSRNIPDSDREVISTIKVVLRGSKAKAAAELKKGDEVTIFGGCLQDDNIRTSDEEDGETRRTTGRLRIESVDKFFVRKKKDWQQFEEFLDKDEDEE